MIKASYFAGKKVLVFGLARSGLGAANALLASGAEVWGLDDAETTLQKARDICPALQVMALPEVPWRELDYVVLSPGVPLYAPYVHPVVELAQQHSVPIITDIDILYLACPNATYIGVTGTNGKSTTVALIEHILLVCGKRVQAGGNIGISAADLEPQEEGFYVLELSSYQLDLVRYLHLDVAVFLNITPDHIDRHGTFEKYLAAKNKIMQILQPNGVGVASLDYEGTRAVQIPAKAIYTSTSDNYVDKNDLVYIKERILHDTRSNFTHSFVQHKYLPGRHNEENLAAAYAVCVSLGLAPDAVVAAIKSFKGLEHRIEVVLQSSRFTFINDSKATNADATQKALLCYDDVYWIAGGVPKAGGIGSILPLIKERVRLALLIGQASAEFAEDLAGAGVPYVIAGTLEAALDYLSALANGSGVVLLSPACASTDQFRNFEHRGEEFKRLVVERFEGD